MRRGFFLMLLACACAGTSAKPAPRVVAQTFDGAALEVGAPSAKPTLIVFWATWCASCRLEMPKLVTLATEQGDAIDIVGVNVDTDVSVAKKFLADANLPYPNVSDPKLVVADAFGASQTPTMILVDASGAEIERGHDLETMLARLEATRR